MDKQDQALKRLLKKLSALRATLKSDERSLLDGLIISSADEAVAHVMNVGARVTPQVTAAADEAVAHAMTVKIIFDPIKDEYRAA